MLLRRLERISHANDGDCMEIQKILNTELPSKLLTLSFGNVSNVCVLRIFYM